LACAHRHTAPELSRPGGLQRTRDRRPRHCNITYPEESRSPVLLRRCRYGRPMHVKLLLSWLMHTSIDYPPAGPGGEPLSPGAPETGRPCSQPWSRKPAQGSDWEWPGAVEMLQVAPLQGGQRCAKGHGATRFSANRPAPAARRAGRQAGFNQVAAPPHRRLGSEQPQPSCPPPLTSARSAVLPPLGCVLCFCQLTHCWAAAWCRTAVDWARRCSAAWLPRTKRCQASCTWLSWCADRLASMYCCKGRSEACRVNNDAHIALE